MFSDGGLYEDTKIVTSDNQIIKWTEYALLHNLHTVLEKGEKSEDDRYLVLKIPFTALTFEVLREFHLKGALPDRTWWDFDDVIRDLAPYSDEQLFKVKKQIASFFISDMTARNCIGIWRLLKNCGLPEQTIQVERFLLINLITFIRDKQIDIEFFRLPDTVLFELLSKNGLILCAEKDVMYAINTWIDVAPAQREDSLPMLAKAIRIEVKGAVEYWRGHRRFLLTFSNLPSRAVQQRMMAIGGWRRGPLLDIFIYDPIKERWMELPFRMPYKAAYCAGLYMDNELYIFAGGDEEGNSYSNLYKLNKDLKFVRLANMSEPRCYVTNSCVVLGKHLYVFGGHNPHKDLPIQDVHAQSPRLDTAERYDKEFNTWQILPNMLSSRSDAAAVVFNDLIYVMGGFTGVHVTASVEVYDPVKNRWSSLAPMPRPRAGLSAVASTTAIFAIGGFDGVERCNTLFRYDPLTDMWAELAPFHIPRSNFGACLINYDTIMITGGYSNDVIAESEVFKDGRWSFLPSLPSPRSAVRSLVCPLSYIDKILGKEKSLVSGV